MRRHKAISQPNVINTNFNTIQFFLNILLYLSFVGMLIYGGIDLLKGHYNASMKIPPGLLLLFQIILGLSIIFAFRRKYYKGSMLDFANKFNKPVIPVIVLFSLMFIFSGDRGPVIQIALIALVSYTLYVKPMRMKSFILIIFAGMFFLTIISYARIKSGYDKTKTGIDIKNGLTKFKIKSFYDVGMDLIINNRNLYTGYEHEKINGMNYGKSLSYQLFAPFPILPSLFTHIMFNTDPEKLSSSYILTKESKASYGLGTNIIIDLFMAFGPVGVILCMLFLGLLVTRIQLKASTGNSLNYVISYIFLVSLSIYMPRSTILDPLRPIIWALFIYNLLLSVRLLLIKLSHADSLNGHTNPKEIT